MKTQEQPMRILDQSVFDGQPPEVTLACVDYDGLLKFGKNVRNYRYTWASERWRGADWVEQRERSGYKPLTSIRRDTLQDTKEDQAQCVCQLGGEPSGMADPCMVCPAKVQAEGCGFDGLPEGCPMAREGDL